MSKRFLFLSGHLSGLLIGGLLVGIYFANRPTPLREARIPVYEVAVPDSTNPVPQPDYEWPSFEFNGKPVYIVPLVQSSD